jgi:hypothetical protein
MCNHQQRHRVQNPVKKHAKHSLSSFGRIWLSGVLTSISDPTRHRHKFLPTAV